MAPESLTEMVFSSQSDVWSFGIVLWEIFSLGKVPYPGMNLKELIRELQDGYRMEKPQFASNEIGRLMTECWKALANERPTFNQLQEALGNHLEASMRHHYLEMSQTYLQVEQETREVKKGSRMKKKKLTWLSHKSIKFFSIRNLHKSKKNVSYMKSVV